MYINIDIGDLLHSDALGFGLVVDKKHVRPPEWSKKTLDKKKVNLAKVHELSIFWSGGEEVQSGTYSHIMESIDWDNKSVNLHIVSKNSKHINDVD